LSGRKRAIVWLCGTSINAALIALPALSTGAIGAAISDPRLLLVVLLLSLWIATDLSAGGEELEHYRCARCTSQEHAWICQGIGLAVFALVYVGATELTLAGPHRLKLISTVAGTTVCLAGLLLRFMSVKALGRHFTTSMVVLQEQALETIGVYRHIRHPSYSGLLLILIGLCVLLESRWSTLILIFTAFPLVLVRIGAEERVMSVAFGDRYGRYKGQTKRLLPFVF
jgi:protein-S-isoprenylcysteine O-methyltransferase Ste14